MCHAETRVTRSDAQIAGRIIAGRVLSGCCCGPLSVILILVPVPRRCGEQQRASMQVLSSGELGLNDFLYLRLEMVVMNAPDYNPFLTGSRVDV